MKIVNVTSLNLWPLSTGGARYALSSVIELCKHNDIVMLTTKDSFGIKLYYPKMKIIPSLNNNTLLKFSPMTLIKLLKIISNEKPNLIIFDFPWLGIYGLLINLFLHIPFDIREQNVEHLRFKQLGKWWWKLLMFYEGFVYKNCQKIRYISTFDKKTIQHTFGFPDEKFIYSPYIADHKVFHVDQRSRQKIRKLLKLENKKIVLFFGSLDYQPNKEALENIATKIAPKFINNKKVIFLVVGKNPPTDVKYINILFTGYVEKIEDYINASDLVIVPLISGGGVRTKIIESLKCNKKIISTRIGAESILNSNLIVAPITSFYTYINKEL